jgi:hypothetical protein
MFQAGPPGPGSAPSPAGKPNPSAGQNPYATQGLYGQGQYDDLGYQHHGGHGHQHQHQQSVGGGLPSTDYSKQLYGAGQGFMGLGQSSLGTPGGAAPASQLSQRGGGSPETSYKPYGQGVNVNVGAVKDVGGGAGQPGQGRAGVPQQHQQQQQGSFYGSGRFASGGASGPQGQQSQHSAPQGQGPQSHLGYQGNSDNGFYSYQPRQGYWQ